MTPTTNERDRFEAWAKDTMSLVKEPGGYKEATTHHAWRAWQAALTSERREGVRENDAIAAAFREVIGPNGASIRNDEIADYITQRSKEIVASQPQQEAPGAVGVGSVSPQLNGETASPAMAQPETPSEREARDLRHELIRVYRSIGNDEMADKHEATLTSEQREGVVTFAVDDVRFAVPASIAEKVAAKLAPADNLPQPEAPGAVCVCGNPEAPYTVHRTDGPCYQQEAPGAVAPYGWVHEASAHVHWRADDPLVVSGKCRAVYTTPPAPVDVRKLRELANELRNEAGDWDIGSTRGALQDAANRIEALLDGQQAGVDDAMVERAINACCTSGAYFAPETDDEWRAVLQAALGGGGGRG